KGQPSLRIDWEGSEFLELAEASAGIGVWDMDLATGLVRGRPQFFRVMGLEPRADPVSVEVFRALRHPEDRAKVVDGFRQMLAKGTDYYESEYRILRPDGQMRWILGRGRIVRNAHGTPARYFGVDIDIAGSQARGSGPARRRGSLPAHISARSGSNEHQHPTRGAVRGCQCGSAVADRIHAGGGGGSDGTRSARLCGREGLHQGAG